MAVTMGATPPPGSGLPVVLRRCGALAVYQAIRDTAHKNPQVSAIMTLRDHDVLAEPDITTYEQLLADMHRCANVCIALGLQRTDRVVIILPLMAPMQAILWGVQSVCIAMPVNPFLEAAALRGLMQASQARAVFVIGPRGDDGVWKKLQAIRSGLADLRHVICVGSGAGPDSVDYASACEAQPDGHLLAGNLPCESDMAAFFHTGGTTGTPKLAMLTHAAMMAKCWATRLTLGERENERAFLALPLFHVLGALIVSLRVLATGKTLIMAPPGGFRHESLVRQIWQLAERHRITDLFAVPTIYAALAETPLDGADIASLHRLYTGASTVPVSHCKVMKQLTGLDLLEGYGMTEACGLAAISPPEGGGCIGSAGPALPFHPLRTVRLDDAGRFGRFCRPGEIGVIALGGPGLASGYLDPAQTETLFIANMPDGGRWINSGDLGRLDEKGHIWITGRAKDLIIRGGHNIDPQIIEEALYAHQAVQTVAAVGQPDRRKGELPVAYVELKPGARADEAELQKFAAARIPERAAIPVQVHILPVMPLTAMGKIFKPSLVRDAACRAFAEVLEAEAPGLACQISTREDARHGLLVRLVFGCKISADLEARLRVALAPFAMAWELHWRQETT